MSDSVKRRRRNKRLALLLAAAVLLALALGGYWLAALALLLVLYLANELLWADHIFYSPGEDYRYQLGGDSVEHVWRGHELAVVPGEEVCDTLLLQLPVTASLSGRWFDPWIEISCGEQCLRQYLERGVAASRYINISAFSKSLASGQVIALRGHYCALNRNNSQLWGFYNDDLTQQRSLVLAPHADDAEIAAFGFYSQAKDCTLVTVTAGETEVDQFLAWVDDQQQASRFKGEVRGLDSVAAALWGGLDHQNCINLGYGCLQLPSMHEQPAAAVSSPWSGLADTRPYRRLNRQPLPSDVNGATSWNNLLDDLRVLLEERQPQVLLCPHPLLDSHRDHRYSTLALWLACQQAKIEAPQWLLYANHLDASQDFPFGPAHSEAGLPPYLGETISLNGLYRVGLDSESRRRKALALDLMHDLRRPLRFKKWWRRRLQALFLRRPLPQYGEDDYFRRALRNSELFFVAGQREMETMLESLE